MLSLGWQQEGEFTLSREELELLTCLGVQMATVEKVKNPTKPVEKSESILGYVCDLCEGLFEDLEMHLKNTHRVTESTDGDLSTFCKQVINSVYSKTNGSSKKYRPQPTKKTDNECPEKKTEPKIMGLWAASGTNDSFMKAMVTTTCETSKPSENISEHHAPQNLSVKCPKCPKLFDGSLLKNRLRCHIGNVHYGRELRNEVKLHFKENKCQRCKKYCKTETVKSRHLLFKHTKYVDIIRNQASRALGEKSLPRDFQIGLNASPAKVSVLHVSKFQSSSNILQLPKSERFNEHNSDQHIKLHEKSMTNKSVKCPSCPKIFDGKLLKDRLRCHIGSVHYASELRNEAKLNFKDNSCKKCNRYCKDGVARVKHLIYTHTKYVNIIRNEALKALEEKIVSGKANPLNESIFVKDDIFRRVKDLVKSKDENTTQTDIQKPLLKINQKQNMTMRVFQTMRK